MGLTPTISVGRQHVEAYGDGGFRVSGKRWQGSVLVFREQNIAWPVKTFAEIEIVHLMPVIEPADGARWPRPARHLRNSGISIEPMDTGGACRTYNVLANENRKVAVALIAIQ
jgi:uncharacterized protein